MTPLRMITAESITFSDDEVRIKLYNEEELIVDAKLDSVWLNDKSITFLIRGMVIDWQITLLLNWHVSIDGKWRHVDGKLQH